VEEQSLRTRLVREGELPIADAVRILRDVVDALTEAHAHGVVHRDIKPENILLRGRHALVTDFGVSKAVSEATGRAQLTTAGVALGTPAYMAPEQATADPHLDHRVDLYAVGAVAYELLTGRPVFMGATPQMVLSAHMTEPPQPVSRHRDTVPAALEAVVMRCLEKKPADRFQSAEELLAQLEALATPSGGLTPMDTRPLPEADGRRRWLLPLGVAALVVVAVVLTRVLTPRPFAITTSNSVHVTSEPGLEFQPAISPNGEEVAYVVGPIGNPRVAMQSTIDVGRGGEARPADAVGGVQWFPSWTPGGASIRFMTCAVGRVVSRLGPDEDCDWHEVGKFGGTTRVIGVRRPRGRHAWSRDGTRVAVAVQDSIFAYSSDGGEPELLGIRVGEAPGPHSLAWSPDGRWIAFVSGNASWRTSANKMNASIWILDSYGGEPVQVTNEESMNVSPQWLPDSRHLLFVSNRDGARGVYVVEVGPDGARGSPRSVPGASDPHSISVSADGRKLAYAKLTVAQNIRSVPIPRSGTVSIRDATPVTFGNQVIESHSVSPDGEWIAFSSTRLGNSDIYRMRLNGEPAQPQMIADYAGEAFVPDWSPDGTEIVFSGLGSEQTAVEVLVVPATGGTPVPLTDFPGSDHSADWSSDGLSLVFVSQGPQGAGNAHAWMMERERVGLPWGEPVQVTDFGCDWPDWEPDGSSFVCMCDPDTDVSPACSENDLVWVSRTGDIVARYDPAEAGLSAVGSPRFSRDGSRLFFLATHEDGSEGVWSIPARGGPATRIVAFDDPALAVFDALSVGPDHIYLTVSEYESDIWVMDLEW
jgi:Tol biopolymer transport system component